MNEWLQLQLVRSVNFFVIVFRLVWDPLTRNEFTEQNCDFEVILRGKKCAVNYLWSFFLVRDPLPRNEFFVKGKIVIIIYVFVGRKIVLKGCS